MLRNLNEAISHRGPDDAGLWINGTIGMGYRALWTTPLAPQEKQPLENESRSLCLTLDGRVDNGEELKSALQSRGLHLRTDSDAELFLKAYECWGEECAEKILGDFAVVIWDQRKRQLVCMRDAVGIKPFYYYADQHKFLWASELNPLLSVAGVPVRPNEAMIGEYLAVGITSREETLFQGIQRLPPAHILTVRDGAVVKRRYWDIDLSKEIRYGSDSDYVEHFREILVEAVRCRLRANGPVGFELSGGLDSSSVLAIAQSLTANARGGAEGHENFSVAFPGRVFDESSYVNEVLRFCDLDTNMLVWKGDSDPLEEESRCFRFEFPSYPNQWYYLALYRLARSKGVRVLLNGYGGDEWLWGSPWHCADLLRRLKIIECLRELKYRSENNFGWSAFLNFAVKPLFPAPLKSRLATIQRHLRRQSAPPWISPHFADKIGLFERIRARSAVPHEFRTHAQRDLYSWLHGGWIAHVLETSGNYAARFSLEYRSPLHDRRIIEFALALPENQRWRGEKTKFILRETMANRLPELVRSRTQKEAYDQVFAEAIAARGGENLFRSLRISSLGWVCENELMRMCRSLLDGYKRDQEWLPYCWPLWTAFAIDRWHKSVLT
ncbi:MAG TPA: asparagine synthase (glutamine-hydrolyzing) [Terracidiphilus sp.]|nr:asparagine synthase (glutamine-hydrolyzing) [Terracidiphilus sp.]